MFDIYVRPTWNYIRDASVTTQCIVGATSLYAFYHLVLKKKYKLPPGPQGLPVLGNLIAFRKDDMLDKLSEWQKKYGPILTMYLGPICIVVINDIDLAMEALVNRGSDFSSRPVLYSFDKATQGSKDIALAPYGDCLKYQRKVAAQSLRQYLTGQQLEARVHMVLKEAIQNIESEKGPFILSHTLSLCVFNVLHCLCFENMVDLDDTSQKLMTFIHDLTDVGNGFLEDIFPPLRYWPTKKLRDFQEGVNFFRNYIHEHWTSHKDSFDKDSIRCLTDNIILTQRELMETDSASLKYMTDVHATLIIFDIFAAGIDNVHCTLDWIFYIMITYPDIQERMQKEIDDIVGGKIPGKEHRAKLVYTEAVILETLRLYAVTPLSVPHETMRDTTVGGYEIPAKTTVMINQHLILRDPKHWEDPLEFKPERFISEDGTKILRNRSFIPFSVGHRSCLGETLSKLSIMFIVVGLLQRFTFSLPPGQKTDSTPITGGFGFGVPLYQILAEAR